MDEHYVDGIKCGWRESVEQDNGQGAIETCPCPSFRPADTKTGFQVLDETIRSQFENSSTPNPRIEEIVNRFNLFWSVATVASKKAELGEEIKSFLRTALEQYGKQEYERAKKELTIADSETAFREAMSNTTQLKIAQAIRETRATAFQDAIERHKKHTLDACPDCINILAVLSTLKNALPKE